MDLILDSQDNVFVLASSNRSSNVIDTDLLTLKYTASGGALRWSQRYNGPGDDTDRPVAIELSPDGGVVIAGVTSDNSPFDFLTVKYVPAGQPLNISTRVRVNTGENALIGGFIVTGDAPKKVLIRAISSSLTLPGKLEDPTLELNTSAGEVIFNDNWKTHQEAEIRATTIPPESDLEAAIVATLEPGPHTAILRGKGETTGQALVEVYDLDQQAPSTLANISTRGQVETGDNVMIGGFIIGSNHPARVLLRAIGPSLAEAGVSGALQDPTLELVDANGTTISNDNWRETQEAEIAAILPPPHDKEAAIAATLTPGPYTAIVRGKDNTTGVALVEAYNLQ